MIDSRAMNLRFHGQEPRPVITKQAVLGQYPATDYAARVGTDFLGFLGRNLIFPPTLLHTHQV